jgi:Zn finger protein HypA/HybF involved in hydrogenase expression
MQSSMIASLIFASSVSAAATIAYVLYHGNKTTTTTRISNNSVDQIHSQIANSRNEFETSLRVEVGQGNIQNPAPSLTFDTRNELDSAQPYPQGVSLTAYCLKCKKKNVIASVEKTVTKNGRTAYKGNCEVCGGKAVKIVGKN